MNPQSLQAQMATGMLQGGSPLNVATQGSPTYDPSLQPTSPIPSPNQSIAGQFSPSQMQQSAQQQPQQGVQDPNLVTIPTQDSDPQTPGTQVPFNEVEGIIGALNDRLKAISSIHKQQTEHLYPTPQQPQAQGGA